MTQNSTNVIPEPAPDFECGPCLSGAAAIYHEAAGLYARTYDLIHNGDTTLMLQFFTAAQARTIFETGGGGRAGGPQISEAGVRFRVLKAALDKHAQVKTGADADPEWVTYDVPPATDWTVRLTLAWSFDNPEGLLPAGAPEAA